MTRDGRARREPRVRVDNDRCEHFGLCRWQAPALFDLGGDGRLRYRRRLAEADVAAAVSAARCCPTQAIALRGVEHG